MLYEIANLAKRLGFKLSEIIALKENPQIRDIRILLETFKSLLITKDVEVKKKRRCGLLSVKKYIKDSESLFINYLYNVDKEQGEGLTFFIRKFIYLAFFRKPLSLSLEEMYSKDMSGSGNSLYRVNFYYERNNSYGDRISTCV